MITISPVNDPSLLDELYNQKNLLRTPESSAVAARFGDELLGYCLYDINEKNIVIRALDPEDDIMLADGILRSALHVAAERSAMDARFADSAPEELLKKLGFILDIDERTIDIDKLFGGCSCGK